MFKFSTSTHKAPSWKYWRVFIVFDEGWKHKLELIRVTLYSKEMGEEYRNKVETEIKIIFPKIPVELSDVVFIALEKYIKMSADKVREYKAEAEIRKNSTDPYSSGFDNGWEPIMELVAQ